MSNNYDQKLLASELIRLREISGMTVPGVADYLGVSRWTIRDWENGEGRLRPETVSHFREKLRHDFQRKMEELGSHVEFDGKERELDKTVYSNRPAEK